MKRSTHHLLAAILVGLFGLFLTYGSQTSSEFFRGLYVPPNIDAGSGPWADMAGIHANRIWNYRKAWQYQGSGGMATYLGLLGQHGLKAILRDGDWAYGLTDSIPYLVEHYSCGQHKQLEAELDSVAAIDNFFTENGLDFYYFDHDGNGDLDPGPPAAWHLDPAEATVGNCVFGPQKTVTHGNGWLVEPNFDWPESYNYADTSRTYQIRVRSKADKTGQADSTLVYCLTIDERYDDPDTDITVHDYTSMYRYVVDYDADETYEVDSINIVVYPDTNTFGCIKYSIYYFDNVELWIDWIEYMDMEQAYPLFADSATSAQTLAQINGQCGTLEPVFAERWRY